MKYLQLAFNKIAGTIPSSLFNISTLLDFKLMSNQLSGTIHPDIGLAFPHLIQLSVVYNRFTGSIPVSLSNASNLVYIQFQNNDFIRTVRRDLGVLHNAQIIGKAHNQLEGSIRGDDLSFIPSLVNCTQLKYLMFGDNSLRGSLPQHHS